MIKPIHKRNQPALPTSVKVGHRDIAIVLVSAAVLVDSYGDFSTDKLLIRLGDWLKPQDLAEVLIHELLHACWPQRWSLSGDIEENVVAPMSLTMAQVWRDNPHVVEWITHSLLGE